MELHVCWRPFVPYLFVLLRVRLKHQQRFFFFFSAFLSLPFFFLPPCMRSISLHHVTSAAHKFSPILSHPCSHTPELQMQSRSAPVAGLSVTMATGHFAGHSTPVAICLGADVHGMHHNEHGCYSRRSGPIAVYLWLNRFPFLTHRYIFLWYQECDEMELSVTLIFYFFNETKHCSHYKFLRDVTMLMSTSAYITVTYNSSQSLKDSCYTAD